MWAGTHSPSMWNAIRDDLKKTAVSADDTGKRPGDV
jgi:hypothetical protein